MKANALEYISHEKNILILVIAVCATILFNIFPLEYTFPFLIIFVGLLLGAVIILIDSPREFNTIFFLFIAGFSIRILLSVFLYSAMSIIGKDEGFFIGDGCNYSLNGWVISRLWEVGVHVSKADFVSRFGSASGTVSNYDFLNAFIYSISGYSPVSLFFVNCLAGSIPIILIFIISKNIFNKEVALVSSALCAFWPSFILWSSQNLKDPLTNLGIIGFLYFLIKLRHDLKMSTILLLCFSAIVLYYIRMITLVPLGAASLAYFLFCFKLPKIFKLAFIFFLALTALFLLKDVFFPYLRAGLLEEINANRVARAYGRLAYFSGFRFYSWWSVLIYLPLGFFATWFLPFPWQVFSLSQIFAVPEILAWYLFLPFSVRGIYLAIKNRSKDSYLLIATIIIFAIFLTIYEGNIGTLYRHKAIVTMLVFIFIGAGWQSKTCVNSALKF